MKCWIDLIMGNCKR